MDIIDVTIDNLKQEHICCAITDKKGENCVSSKKAWMKERFEDGLVFKKLDVRGKVFIEYIPAENAWCPIDAKSYMHINCLWVSGKYKGQGYANQLLDKCIIDAKSKGKCGLTILSSKKKLPFLSDPMFLKNKGFILADIAVPFFELYYLPFEENAPIPKFKPCAKEGLIEEKGFVLYYSHQCPFTAKYVPLVENIAKQYGVPLKLYKIETTKQAQDLPSPCTTYSLFYNGSFLTNEILSEKKFASLLEENINNLNK
ncbi:MAG: GNAT family N-acetyltransferase [Aminipila sp.]